MNPIITGSFHTGSKHILPIWHDTAKTLFKDIKDDNFVKRNGVYEKMIIDCAFKENLLKKKLPDDIGGCKDFHPSLTTNGICYTFNGQDTSELWKTSEIMTTFSKILSSKSVIKTFGGPRTWQGKDNEKDSTTLL